MGTPTNLLTIEVGGGYEVLQSTTPECDHYEMPTGQEMNASEEIVVIRGTITVSP